MPKLNQFVVFNLKDEEYGVDVLGVKEIASPTTVTRVPRSPAYMDGLFNLRGSLVPLVNLRKKFGFDAREIDEETRFIIAELEDKYIGMQIDSATEVLRIPPEDIDTTPDMLTTDVSKDYLLGIGKVGDRLIIILDLKQVFTKKEIKEIKVVEKTIKKQSGKYKKERKSKEGSESNESEE